MKKETKKLVARNRCTLDEGEVLEKYISQGWHPVGAPWVETDYTDDEFGGRAYETWYLKMERVSLPVDYTKLSGKQRREVRELYRIHQNDLCPYCQNKLDSEPAQAVLDAAIDLGLFPFGFLKNPIHLHHDHNTGMTIGAVHARCNAVLWQYHGE